jgi:hypothetical protein
MIFEITLMQELILIAYSYKLHTSSVILYCSFKMNDYEVTKLKKELQRKQELLKEEREDRESTEKRLVLVQAVPSISHRNVIVSIANL